MTYTMHIEKPAGTVRQHGFHLGTDRVVAETIVLERLRADRDVVSIALKREGEQTRIYDHRDVDVD